jgi:hypothetical protein
MRRIDSGKNYGIFNMVVQSRIAEVKQRRLKARLSALNVFFIEATTYGVAVLILAT